MDVLSPIVNNLKHPDLHYLKDSGVYKCADTKFVVWDVWEKEDDYIEAKDFEGDTKIVLFHGTVDKSETDLGFFLPSDVRLLSSKVTIWDCWVTSTKDSISIRRKPFLIVVHWYNRITEKD